MTSMYRIPRFFYQDELYGFINNLIDRGYTSYKSLKETHKEEIALLIIKIRNSEAIDLVIGDDCETILHLFSKFMKTANKEDAYDLLNHMRTNATTQYAYDIDELMNEIMVDREHTKRKAYGFISFPDSQTGETLWRKAV